MYEQDQNAATPTLDVSEAKRSITINLVAIAMTVLLEYLGLRVEKVLVPALRHTFLDHRTRIGTLEFPEHEAPIWWSSLAFAGVLIIAMASGLFLLFKLAQETICAAQDYKIAREAELQSAKKSADSPESEKNP